MRILLCGGGGGAEKSSLARSSGGTKSSLIHSFGGFISRQREWDRLRAIRPVRSVLSSITCFFLMGDELWMAAWRITKSHSHTPEHCFCSPWKLEWARARERKASHNLIYRFSTNLWVARAGHTILYEDNSHNYYNLRRRTLIWLNVGSCRRRRCRRRGEEKGLEGVENARAACIKGRSCNYNRFIAQLDIVNKLALVSR